MEDDTKRLQALRVLELSEDATWSEIEAAYHHLLARYSSQSLASYGLLRVPERHKLIEALGKAYLRLISQRDSQPPPSRSPEASPDPTDDDDASPEEVATAERAGALSSVGARGGARAASAPASRPPEAKPPTPPRSVPSSPARSSPAKKTGSLATLTQAVSVLETDALEQKQGASSHGGGLREARQTLRLSLPELANLLGCSCDTLERLEGRRYESFASSQQLRQLVDAYAAAVGVDRQRAVTDTLSDFWTWRAHWRKTR